MQYVKTTGVAMIDLRVNSFFHGTDKNLKFDYMYICYSSLFWKIKARERVNY